ncbi:hypothetical protein KIW84_012749 [Lathyrus oleraceus]|uniref:DEAD/DEAH-box helicase domain-containing protein n=1 Tax=Pisum sativum TaxID=3888 RepID=A0A9D5GX71_PEA|nr:hypothetical protein KIW84_012749 [Pisum sativum]
MLQPMTPCLHALQAIVLQNQDNPAAASESLHANSFHAYVTCKEPTEDVNLSCITTVAFCIPARKIDQDNNFIQVVILVPTRELASQTSQVYKELGKHWEIQVMETYSIHVDGSTTALYNELEELAASFIRKPVALVFLEWAM